MTSTSSMHEAEPLGQPRWVWGWDGKGAQDEGTNIHLWLIHVDVWQNTLQYCKLISLELKKKLGPY